MSGYNDPNHPGNGDKYKTGKKCIEGCGREAGTAWGPHWCVECNIKRLNKISSQFDDLIKSSKKRFEGDMMIVYRVSLADDPKNSYIESDLRVVVDMIKEMDVFDGYTIHKLDITKLDYEELPEFTGF